MVQWLRSSYRPTATQKSCQRQSVKTDTETERTGKKHDILLKRLGEGERDWQGNDRSETLDYDHGRTTAAHSGSILCKEHHR